MTYPGHPTINYLHVSGRGRDLLAEAEQARQVAQTPAAKRIVPTFRNAVRWTVGVQLIRAGERIQGASPEVAAQAA